MTAGITETALVTGASAGIGLELARIFARNKINLLLVARSTDKLFSIKHELEKEHGITVSVFTKDLSEAGAASDVKAFADENSLEVTYLVNNAGYGLHGEFIENDLNDDQGMIDLNITCLTQLTKLFVPPMVKRGKGRVLQVSSLAGFMPGPYMSVYFASKAYVLNFSIALNRELKGSGVTVTSLNPGFTDTSFIDRAGIDFKSKIIRRNLPNAVTVAEDGYNAMMKGELYKVTGFIYKLIAVFSGVLPLWFVSTLGAKVLKKL